MKMNWIIPPLCLTVGFAAGFLNGDSPSGTNTKSSFTGAQGDVSSPAAAPNVALDKDGTRSGRRDELLKQLKSMGYLPGRAQRRAELFEFVASLTLPELQLAGELLQQLPSSIREDAKMAFALRFLEIDPQEAARFVQSQRDDSGNFYASFMSEWQRRDPKAAISWFAQLSGGTFQDIQAAYALRRWATTEPQQAADLLMSLPAKFGKEGVKAIFESWSEQNPEEAISRAISLGNVRLRQQAITVALPNWVKKDPDSAFAWFQQLTDEKARNELAVGIAIGLSAKDRAQAIDLLRSLPEGRPRDAALAKLAESIRFTGGTESESLSLVHEIPFEPGNKALMSYYTGFIYDNPGAVANSLLQRFENADDPDERQAIEKYINMNLPLMTRHADSFTKSLAETSAGTVNPLRLKLLENAAHQWAQSNLNEARKWSESLPAGEARDRAITGIVLSWAWSAQSEAAAWIDQQPPSTNRDAAVSGFVKAALGRAPGESLARLRTMGDPAAQLATLQEGWKYWSRRDRTAAEAWLNTSPDLTQAERAALNPNNKDE